MCKACDAPLNSSARKGALFLFNWALPCFFACETALAGQLAQGDYHVARGALQTISARFQSVSISVGTNGDGSERLLDLTFEAASLCFRLLLSARHLKVGDLWFHIHKWKIERGAPAIACAGGTRPRIRV
jgi:hypothetical protein